MVFTYSPFHPDLFMCAQDLLEKGWGWNRLVPYLGSHDCHDWSSYKNYLKQYYCHNHTKLGAQACLNEKVSSAACTPGNGAGVGTGLAPLVRMVTSCLVL